MRHPCSWRPRPPYSLASAALHESSATSDVVSRRQRARARLRWGSGAESRGVGAPRGTAEAKVAKSPNPNQPAFCDVDDNFACNRRDTHLLQVCFLHYFSSFVLQTELQSLVVVSYSSESCDGTGPRAARRTVAPGTWRVNPSPRRSLPYGLAACIRSLHVASIVFESAYLFRQPRLSCASILPEYLTRMSLTALC